MNLSVILVVPAPRLVCVELNPGPATIGERKREKIITLLQDVGLGVSETARALNTTRQTVQETKKKYAETKSVKNRPGQGRKRKLTPENEEAVKMRGRRDQDAPQIAAAMSKKLQIPITERLIQRTLNETLKYIVKEEVLPLSGRNKQKRVKFARDHVNDDWKYVLFTDEKTFEIGCHKRKGWQNPKKKRKLEKLPHAKKLHVWAGVGYYFRTKLHFFEGNLDSDRYKREILKKYLPPTPLEECLKGTEDDWIFLQDNATWHKAADVVKWLEQEAPLYCKDFPPLSPDFNVIEDVWSQLAHSISHKNIKSIPSLKRNLKKAWSQLSWDKVRNSINSMQTRCRECIKHKGERFGF